MARECHRQLGQGAREADGESDGPRVVSVGDREADIYELLVEAQQHRAGGLHLLVRSQHNRRQVADGDGPAEHLWEALAGRKEMGRVEVEVPRKGGLKKRGATLEVRCRVIELDVPAHKRKYLEMETTVKVHAIGLREVDAPANNPPIHWRLVTTMEVETLEQAIEVALWYALRWQVEVLHRVLKTGCRVERRQLRGMSRLRPMIAMDLVVASYLMGMVGAARSRPQTPASGWLAPDELEALYRYHGRTGDQARSSRIGEAVGLIGRLGGHLGRKCVGPPGAEVLWRGLRKLEAITAAWLIFNGRKKCG